VPVLISEYTRENSREKGINMTSATLKSTSSKLLGQLRNNVQREADTVMALLPKIDNEETGLKSELTVLLDGYEAFINRMDALLRENGEPGEGNGLWSRMTAKVGVAMSTLTDTSHSRLASLIIEQSTAGMNEAIRLLREFENTDASEASLALVRDIIAFEEKNVELFKRHL